ncbi:hypothetical protein EVAR_35312_1 [Eumeta japonica]|uniref:Uncharacterized protein n=1 Tax=Eumeta variegata TaxID=151549 RepID=A0A4C1XKA5_EUMVA|nr:hypothetical protein EVAR_35312_1 [Eumeta japonica]
MSLPSLPPSRDMFSYGEECVMVVAVVTAAAGHLRYPTSMFKPCMRAILIPVFQIRTPTLLRQFTWKRLQPGRVLLPKEVLAHKIRSDRSAPGRRRRRAINVHEATPHRTILESVPRFISRTNCWKIIRVEAVPSFRAMRHRRQIACLRHFGL